VVEGVASVEDVDKAGHRRPPNFDSSQPDFGLSARSHAGLRRDFRSGL